MKISTKSQYGLRAMAYLAQKNGLCSVKEISVDEKIPFDYLGKIFLKLKKARLVGVKRGKQGGYFLSKSPESISVGEVIRALDGSTAPVSCLGLEKKYLCPHNHRCATKKLWAKIQQGWESTLDSLTLQQAIK